MRRTTSDELADRLLKRCLVISLVGHIVGFSIALPLALMRAEKPRRQMDLTFIDLGEPTKQTPTSVEESKPPEAEKPKATTPRPQPRFPKISPRRGLTASASKRTSGKRGSPAPMGAKVAKLPPGTPGSERFADEVAGSGSEGARPDGRILDKAPGPKPFDPNDSGGAKVAPGGRGAEEQTPLPRGVPIGKRDANLPFNPNLTTMGGGRSGLNPDDNRPGGGPVDAQRRTPETAYAWGGGGGKNLPKALPRIGGGGGSPDWLASHNPRANDSIRADKAGEGPGEGGGIGAGAGGGVGFSRGAGIGLKDGKVPVGTLQTGIGKGIGQGSGDGIGIGTASRPGRGEEGPGTGEGAGFGYGRGSGIGMGDGGGGSKFKTKNIGLPFGEPGGMVGGTGKGGGTAGSGPGGPGYGVAAAGIGRGSGGGGGGGIGAGVSAGVGKGRGGGGGGGRGMGIGTGLGTGLGSGGDGGGGGGGGGTGGRGRGGSGGGTGTGEVAGTGSGDGRGTGRGVANFGKGKPGINSGGDDDEGYMLTRGFLNGGLKGEYYDDPKKKPGDYLILNGRPAPGQKIDWPTFTSLKFTRTDPRINFFWNNKEPGLDPRSEEAMDYIKNKMGRPGEGVGASYFSVRWTGKFYVPEDDEYTFYLEALDDGGRLWIDGQLVIDSWFIQRLNAHSRPITLTKGIHDIRVDYCQGPEWLASIVLSWKGRNFAKEVIGPAQRVKR
jgi:hypothetical protein